MTVEDGKKCLDFANEFRSNPSSIQPKGAAGPVGEPMGALEWSDELYQLALEHSIE